jgi:hypothetical protein
MKSKTNKILTGKLLKLNHKVFAGNYYYEFYNTFDDALNYCEVLCIKTKENVYLLAIDEYIVEKIKYWSSDKTKLYFIVKVLYMDKIFYMRTTAICDKDNLNNIFYIQNGNFEVIS